ncbi:MAG: hypothetical protein EZS28_030549 [Streblomastix strix]|uniref:Uncharacterized protein n=1 Tax=Streblomastix strix TaxID=222440 RepID=A0A5J4UUA7_9EUKA|nr:MAG: hypothetical protein EZS28_030549 [Streblomastix strix]
MFIFDCSNIKGESSTHSSKVSLDVCSTSDTFMRFETFPILEDNGEVKVSPSSRSERVDATNYTSVQ